MTESERMDFLRTTEIFARVPDDLVARISQDIEEVVASKGTTLMRAGETGDAVYLVVKGALNIERDGIHFATLNAGDSVGEFALVDDGPRSADVIAATDAVLLRWERRAFQETLSQSPGVASGLLTILVRKLRQDVASQVEVGLERERWRQDMKRAQEIQMGMLPAKDLTTGHFEAAGHCRPALEVGGDYYDYVCLEDDKLGIILGDVTGHGFYAGLFVAMAKSCLHTQGMFDYTPAKVMAAMNRTLSLSLQSGLMMTCCYILLDPHNRTLSYSNAGHDFPYLLRRRTGELLRLESTDLLLGVPGFASAEYHSQERSLEPGDLLLLFSDGITEAMDASEDMFEEARLEKVFLENQDKSPAGIRDAILQALADHTGGAEQDDDVTLVVAKAL